MKRRYGKLWLGILSICLTLGLCSVDTQAAKREAYTYTITFYAGNHGSFATREQVNVDNSHSGSAYRVEGSGDKITVSGLMHGDRVNFDAAMSGAVALAGDSKYYVKGIRQSGRDNDTVGLSSFRVEGDKDYVVAYGIRGNLTSYVVQYQDASGRTLADSRTYYGNVGDRPVVAFLYIEGYTPQAYNLTGTLSANTADNVFTFVYSRTRSGSSGGGGGTGGSTTAGGTEPTPGTEGSTAGANTGTTGNAPTTATGGTAGAGATGATGEGTTTGDNIAAEGADATGGAAVDAQQVPDEGVPADDTPEIVEAGDGEVPLDTLRDNSSPAMLFPILTGLTAVIALAALMFVWVRRRKNKKETE